MSDADGDAVVAVGVLAAVSLARYALQPLLAIRATAMSTAAPRVLMTTPEPGFADPDQ